jgi:hypothetical protein
MSAWRDEPCDKGFMFEFSSDCFLASGANQDMVTVSSTFLPHPSIRSQKRALRVRSKKLGEGFKQGHATPEKRPFRRSFGFLTVSRFSVRFATCLNIHH